jgi:hypothetical protein
VRARVGPLASRFAKRIAFVEIVVGKDPVDDVPTLERDGVVERAAHDELARPPGTRPLGHPLRPAGPGTAPHHRLDEPEPGRLGGPNHVAPERDLEAGGQAETVDEGERRDLELLEPPYRLDQPLRELADAIRARLGYRLEVVDIHSSGEEFALGPPHERSGVGTLHLRQALAQLGKRALLEEVQGWVVEGEDGDGTRE